MSRNKVNVALRRAKSAYYPSKIASQNNNPKRAWKTINNLLDRSCNDTVINELKINNDSITSPEEMADAFNEYFVQIGPNLACSLAVSDVTFDQFVSPTQSANEVFKLLNGLSSTKATGLDKISSKVLKAAASTIAPSLTYILTTLFLLAVFHLIGKWPDSFQSKKRDHGAFLKTIDQFQFCPQ